MPSSAATTAGLTRQACDRCRGLKLRCTRANDAGACDRCLRKGSRCAYSASLPKGRRRTHEGDVNAGASEDSLAGTSDDTANGFRDTGSPSSSMRCDGFHFDLVGEAGSSTTFDWLHNINSAPCDEVASSSARFPGSHDRDPNKQVNDGGNGSSSTGSGGFESGGDSEEDDTETLIAQLAQLSTLISLLRRSGGDLVKDSTWSSFSSHAQPEPDSHCQARQLPLVGDAVFQSVATWLARGPTDTTPPCSSQACRAQAPKIKTLGDLLYHVFSTSHRFVELVRRVPVSSASSNAAAISVPQSAPHFLDFAMPLLNMDGSTPLGPESAQISTCESQSSSTIASSSNVIRHLLIANHTMLLGIYSDILGLLQRCVGPTASEGMAPLLKVRLVSVVQLCSYLIDRQHQALDLYLFSSIGCLLEPETVPDTMTTESMKAIRTEVRQRILCLQQMVQT